MDSAHIRKSAWMALAIAGVLFATLLAVILAISWQMNWRAAILFSIPMAALAQAIAWGARFTCRSNPLGKTDSWKVAATHLGAGIILGYVWGTAALWLSGFYDGLVSTHYYRPFVAMQKNLYAVGFAYYLLAVAFHYMLFAQQESQIAQERALESSVRARDAELSALKSQINPHFLYNSLNSISALTSIDPARAREMCVALADFLRLTLGMGEKAVIPLREELALLEKYCAIEKVRFGDRLALCEEIGESSKECLLPPLLLQPLFENAVVHGIAQMPEGGWIRLQAERNGDLLSLAVENSWDPEAGGSRKNGVGLKNVQRRLEARYGQLAKLQASAEENIFRVKLQFPAETEKAK